MSIKRVGVLLRKEFVHGSRSFIFVFAIVVPVVLTLLLTLVFGSIFAGKPALGLVDEGDSQMVPMAQELNSIIVRVYDSREELRAEVANGRIDMGLVLPAGFDADVQSGDTFTLDALLWGESQLQDRAVLGTAVAAITRDINGQQSPVDIETIILGEGASVPWEKRLLPFVVLMTALIGGLMVPATSLVEEKQKRTLGGITITPLSLGEVYTAKGLVGVILTIIMTIIILVMNQALGAQPLLLVSVLALGGVMAAAFGVLLGALASDINTLFATIKGLGIFLYAPALLDMFPNLPGWVNTVKFFFPTYYIIEPVIQISQNNAGLSDVGLELAILLALILVLIGAITAVSRSPRLKLA